MPVPSNVLKNASSFLVISALGASPLNRSTTLPSVLIRMNVGNPATPSAWPASLFASSAIAVPVQPMSLVSQGPGG